MWPKLTAWRGPVFIAVSSAMILWLYFSGQLSLYIHPRYHLFTAVMATIAVAGVLLGLGYASKQPADDDHDHDHDHDDDDGSTSPGSRAALWASTILSVATVATLVFLPPATLGSVTVENRAINQSGLGDSQAALAAAKQGDQTAFAAFTVREWAAILRQTQDPAFFRGKPVNVLGFVSEDPDNDDVFYVTRFVVSCCSVDAQPVGIPVTLPGWQDTWATESWVSLTGEFVVNPNLDQSHPLVVRPESIQPAEQPREPYLF